RRMRHYSQAESACSYPFFRAGRVCVKLNVHSAPVLCLRCKRVSFIGAQNFFMEAAMATIRLGDTAPDFSQESTAGTINFHEWLRGQWGGLFLPPERCTSA